MVESMLENINDSSVEAKVIQCFALPNHRMMYKIMRSCIAVKRKEDLWVYKAPLW